MKTMQEILRPDETYNQAVDAAIEREGRWDWVIRVVEEQLIERLVRKEWYAEAAYVLHQLDEICRENKAPLLTNRDYQLVRSFRLFKKE